jgi:competence protein ComEC
MDNTREVPKKQNFSFTPCLMPVLGLIVGIALAHFTSSLLVLTLTLATISAIGFYIYQHHPVGSTLLLAILSVAAGAIHFYQTNSELPANHIRNYLETCPLEALPHVELTGTIVSPATINQPRRTFPYHSSPNLRTRFLLQADRLKALGKTTHVTGLVEVSLPDMHDSYRPGMKVHLVGRLSSIKTTKPKLSCLKAFTYYQDNLIFARISLKDSDSIVTESMDSCSTPALFNRIQEWAHGLLLGNEPPTGPYTDDLLDAVILGKQNFVENEFNQAMTRIGANHFLAVSGFNLAVLAMGLWFIGQGLGLRRNFILLLIIGSTIFYGIVTDFRPSVTRATIMILIVCLGQLRNRRSDTLNALALSAGIILIINPNQLFQPGFQLSFAATLGLIKLSAPIHQALASYSIFPDHPLGTGGLIAKGLEDQIRQLLSASLAASLGAFPLVMYHFNLLSLIGPIGSVVLYPAATFLTLAGFAQLFIAATLPVLNPFIGALTNWTAILLSNLAILLGKIPGSSLTVASPQWSMVIGFMIVLFTPQIRRKFLWSLLIIAMYLSSWLYDSRNSSPWLYVTGPGQGQSVIINTGQGLAMIDIGAAQTGQAAKLVSQLACQYLTQPLFVVLTSPDQKFFNDFWSLKEKFPQTAVMIPESFSHFSPSYEPVAKLMEDLSFNHQAVSEGTTVKLKNSGLQLLYMPEYELSTSEPVRSTPGSVILMEYEEQKVLMTSVLTPMTCKLIELNYPNLKADLLIVSGSATCGKAMEDLIHHAGIKKIVIGGWLNRNLQRQWEQMERRTGCCVIEISQEGGFLVDRLGK